MDRDCNRTCLSAPPAVPQSLFQVATSTMRLTLTMRDARVGAQNFADANFPEAALRQTTTVAREEDADDVVTATRGRLGLAL